MSGFQFNPNAASFSFNPNVAAFSPTGFVPPTIPAPPVAPAAAAVPAPAVITAPVPAAAPATPAVIAAPPVVAAAPEVEDKADEPAAVAPVKTEAVAAAPVVSEAEKREAVAAQTRAQAAPPPAKENPSLKNADERPHLNIVFIGHVDAGKSTTSGNLLCLSGMVDQRLIEKYEREAKEKNRESWYLAYIMDTSEEERAKGKTVEVGRAHFATDARRYTILDAPGHKGYVPNMISGASQADVAVLIISARKGEFEAGFDKSGQTREHAILAKTLGVSKLIVAVNKMDEPSVAWSQERFETIKKNVNGFIKTIGWNPAEVSYIPISGLSGHNLLHHASDPKSPKFSEAASWYPATEPTLLQLLDKVPLPDRPVNNVRFTILDGYKDNGVVALGKVESGNIKFNDVLMLMPGRQKVRVVGVSVDDGEGEIDFNEARAGENVALRITGVDEENVLKGMTLCDMEDIVPVVTGFRATVILVDLDPNTIFSAGYKCVMHAHTAVEDIEVKRLIAVTDRNTKKKRENAPFAVNGNIVQCSIQITSHSICLENYTKNPQLGRFTLRDNTKTIAIGKIDEIVKYN